jgi:hypothetical protein
MLIKIILSYFLKCKLYNKLILFSLTCNRILLLIRIFILHNMKKGRKSSINNLIFIMNALIPNLLLIIKLLMKNLRDNIITIFKKNSKTKVIWIFILKIESLLKTLITWLIFSKKLIRVIFLSLVQWKLTITMILMIINLNNCQNCRTILI